MAFYSRSMIANEWAIRLKATGVTQAQIAEALGYTTQAVYQALAKADPRYVLLVRALEEMTPEQRAALLRERVRLPSGQRVKAV